MTSIVDAYYQSFNIFIILKKEVEQYEKATIKNENYSMSIPYSTDIEPPKLGNLLMEIVGKKNLDQKYVAMINTLYTGDCCIILFDNDKDRKEICQSFWSSVLSKGIEQAIVQMSVIISSTLDELHSLNDGIKNITEFLKKGEPFAIYETFIEYYLFLAYQKTINLFSELKKSQVTYLSNSLMTVVEIYYFIYPVLFIIFIFVIFTYKKAYNSLLNFIGILPSKYITDDENLYKKIIYLEQEFY